jgi:hypothetical protein
MHQTWSFPPIGFVSARRRPPDELANSALFREFRTTGRFWLPGAEEQHGWWGELFYSPGDLPKVTLDDFPSNDAARRGIPLPILLGRLASGICCTVIDGEAWIETYFGPRQYHRATIFAGQFLEGVHLQELSAPIVRSLQCRFTHLDEWLGSPYRIDHDLDNRRSSVEFNPPSFEISLRHQEIPFSLKVSCARSLPAGIRPEGDDWHYGHSLIIRPAAPQALPWFISVAILLRRCLVFLIGSACYTTELVPSFQGIDGSGMLLHPVSVPAVVHKDPHYFATSFKEIAEDLPSVIVAWFENHDRLDLVVRAYSDTLVNEGSYGESIFLGVVQILEHFHGILFPGEARYFPRPQWRQIVKALRPLLPHALKDAQVRETDIPDKAELLIGRLGFVNDLSLQTKLEQLFGRTHPQHLTPLVDIAMGRESTAAEFAARVAKTRHFLTHYDESNAAEAFAGADLQRATASCWAVLTYWLARELGIEDGRAAKMAWKARRAMFVISERGGL